MPPARPSPGDVYFEFRYLPHAVKISAIDAKTGTEVSIMGSRTATRQELEATALAKLLWVLGKQEKPQRKGEYR